MACDREETIYHRFWACPHSVHFWKLLREEKGVYVALPPAPLDNHGELSRWLVEWLAAADGDKREAMIQATYGLWLARNAARDGKRIDQPHEIMESVCSHMAEWNNVHQLKPRPERTDLPQKWEAPVDGWVKINSDGAVHKGGSKVGGGAVLRDHNGAFLAGVCHHFPHIVEPEAAEILACKRALQVAEEINVQNVHLKLDCLPVLQMINQKGINYSGAGPWIQEIKHMLETKNDYKVTWVRRTGNVAAHKLAKVGVGDELCKVWLGVPQTAF